MTLSRALLIALWIASSVGCSEANLGRDDAGRHDGSTAHPPTDECGNGLDDDHNGRIDDGCPCGPGETQHCFSGALASNGVGACMGGTQTCVGGVEWGDWGDGACAGEVGPTTERCDGSDADCDGAIDEGCPCTDGQTRTCGSDFVVAPCTSGTQTCTGGSWSSCVGAVGPTAEVCTDTIDNDCDGTVNDGCGCVITGPEVCRDGIDNDCDGETDEIACTPDWPLPDAGMPDAGTDAAVLPMCGPFEGAGCTETAIDIGNDLAPTMITGISTPLIEFRTSLVEQGCEAAVTYGITVFGGGESVTTYYFERHSLADGSLLSRTPLSETDVTGNGVVVGAGPGNWGVLYTSNPRTGAGNLQLRFQIIRADGALDGPSIVLGDADATSIRIGSGGADVHWDGTRWVITHALLEPVFQYGVSLQIDAVDPATRAVTRLATHDRPHDISEGYGWNGDELAVVMHNTLTAPVTVVTYGGADFHETRSLRFGGGPVSQWTNQRLTRWHGHWVMAYASLRAGAGPADYWAQQYDDEFTAIDAPFVLFDDVSDVSGGAIGRDLLATSLVSDGTRWAAGYPDGSGANDRTARFGNAWPIDPARDLSALGVTSSIYHVNSQVAIGVRDVVLRWQQPDTTSQSLRLLLLCR